MRLASGPECPECGCQDGVALRDSDRWGRPAQKRRCGFCGHVWTQVKPKPEARQAHEATDEKTTGNHHGIPVYVPAIAPPCPECGGIAKVTHTTPPIRRHKCVACGHRFKSMESTATEPRS